MASRKTYHKEDLRGDLLKAGRSYIEANGHLGLSMRTMAQQVGVSPGAPYHHFPDRRSFLLAIALDGFGEMLARTREIAASEKAPVEKLREMGRVFIGFVEENPHLVDLMYESELTTPTIDPQLLAFQRQGHDALRLQIDRSVPGLPGEELDLRTLTFWSAIYGFASMRRKGVIYSTPDTLPALNLADAIVGRATRAVLAP